MSLHPPLQARNGHTLHVLLICRVSNPRPGGQSERSNEDQAAAFEAWIRERTELPCEFTVLAGKGSGEILDRKEVRQAEELIETGKFDAVVAEDLGRYMRRVRAYELCELCEDYDTRLIAPNDHVDTGQDGWRMAAFFAVMRHESYNADTAKRIRRSHRNRFMHGGVVQGLPYGYIKPPGCKSDDDVCKDPEAEQVYSEWIHKLENGATYAEVADWLNEQGVPTGRYCRGNLWTGPMVRRVTFNPILKGVRQRNRKKTRRVNKTGRRKIIDAEPSELLERECPHLAFFEPGRYDRLIRMLTAKNGHTRRKRPDGIDPRKNVPKKRTRWPGQHASCGICGRHCLLGGHGQSDHLICSGAKAYRCWNSVTFDGPAGARKLASAIVGELERLPEFDADLMGRIRDEIRELATSRNDRQRELHRRQQRLEREKDNIVRAIREGGYSATLADALRDIESELTSFAVEQDEIERETVTDIDVPSVDVVKSQLREVFTDLAVGSPEFQRKAKLVIPRLEVFPYRLLDGGHPVLRAGVTLNIGAFLSGPPQFTTALPSLERRLVVNLFEPPQRVRFREQIVELRTTMTQRATAHRLGLAVATVEAAMSLQRKVDALGTTDPYVPLREPPEDYTKLCRHKHRRYRFEPLPGYENPQFPST